MNQAFKNNVSLIIVIWTTQNTVDQANTTADRTSVASHVLVILISQWQASCTVLTVLARRRRTRKAPSAIYNAKVCLITNK